MVATLNEMELSDLLDGLGDNTKDAEQEQRKQEQAHKQCEHAASTREPHERLAAIPANGKEKLQWPWQLPDVLHRHHRDVVGAIDVIPTGESQA